MHTDDALIWEYARIYDFVIVSKDSDFHQRSLLYGHPEPYIEQYHNLDRDRNDFWQWQDHSHLEQGIFLNSLNVEIPLSEIYRRIRF